MDIVSAESKKTNKKLNYKIYVFFFYPCMIHWHIYYFISQARHVFYKDGFMWALTQQPFEFSEKFPHRRLIESFALRKEPHEEYDGTTVRAQPL